MPECLRKGKLPAVCDPLIVPSCVPLPKESRCSQWFSALGSGETNQGHLLMISDIVWVNPRQSSDLFRPSIGLPNADARDTFRPGLLAWLLLPPVYLFLKAKNGWGGLLCLVSTVTIHVVPDQDERPRIVSFPDSNRCKGVSFGRRRREKKNQKRFLMWH